MRKYTLDELIEFLDQERKDFEDVLTFFNDKSCSYNEQIEKYKAVAEELYRLKDLSE